MFGHKYIGIKLNFPLLADTTRKVIRAYDAEGEKSMFGHKYIGIKRMSYLIDPTGKIVTIYESVRARKHAVQVLKELKEKTAV
jgi:peroxiredoxin Q/BCP